MPVKSIISLKRLGEALVEVGILTKEQLLKALEVQKQSGGKLGQILVKLGYITEEVLLAFLGKQAGMQFVSLQEFGEISEEVIKCVPETIVRRQELIPIAKKNNSITIALSDPFNVLAIDEIKLITGCNVEVVIASEKEIKEAIEKYYKKKDSFQELQEIEEEAEKKLEIDKIEILEEKEEIDLGKEDTESVPVVKAVNHIIEHAINSKASDILIEPQEKNVRIRYRIDGIFHDQRPIPKKFQTSIVARIKIMAKIDITEKRKPQDGRIKLTYAGKQINLRISTVPTSFGEKVAIRIIDAQALCLPLQELGFEEEQLKIFEKSIKQPYGMILVTGPTGCGKTTTLYSALNVLNNPDVNIMTVEEPVEVVIYGINQVNVNEKAGLTFASALRAFLRQDPDIIMVGEIRDKETIEIAINASLTGHLVFSTLHTNDAPSSITRLLNMNVEPFLVASTLTLVVSQKLLRKVCKYCREPYNVESEQLKPLGVTPEMVNNVSTVSLYKGRGCQKCLNGYKGRIGIFETLEITEKIKELIIKGASHFEIKKAARKQGMLTLREIALRKLLAGVTTVEEVIKNTFADEIQE